MQIPFIKFKALQFVQLVNEVHEAQLEAQLEAHGLHYADPVS